MDKEEVETIKHLFYYQYAKIVTKFTYGITDDVDLKPRHYGLIKSTFRSYKYGNKLFSNITQEDSPGEYDATADNKCAYCGSIENDLQRVSIIPKTLNLKPECSSCEKVQSTQNNILSCPRCILNKGNLGLYEFYKQSNPNLVWFYDIVPRLIEKQYLKTMYHCHECAATLEKSDLDGDGELTVLDIDYILH